MSKSNGESMFFAEVMCTEPDPTGWATNAAGQYTFWFAGGGELPRYLRSVSVLEGRKVNNDESVMHDEPTRITGPQL